ncbi:MAG TPA: lysine--tRNA ligase [Planctomycetaceae bacterium]|nr:lysine--tRNA ligase [Planctomycetaceae bacterium]
MSAETPDRLEAARLEKLRKIEALGIDPWGQRFDGHRPIREAREQCPVEAGIIGPEFRIAGRVMLANNKGKLRFFHIQDWSGRIQLMLSKADFSDADWELVSQIDLGDIVGADGHLKLTNTGEKTIGVTKLTYLTKSLAQPPEKFHGAQDTEMLLRQRYVDLIYNDGVLDRMLRRAKIISSIRKTLGERNFVEAETPVLHAIAGGAAARPFITHHNTLDIDLYLRIALELHLKRMMVGGIERVYEIGRVFRNEGIDATHNPEFTMIELYQAYADYNSMMELAEAIIVNAAAQVHEKDFVRIEDPGDSSFEANDLVPRATAEAANATLEKEERHTRETRKKATYRDETLPPHVLPWGRKETIDFTPPWKRCKYADLFREHAGCEMHDAPAVAAVAKKHGITTEGKHPDVIINDVFEATVEDALMGPVFVIDYPSSMCPLTKRKQGQPEIAERFEMFVQGMELANAYTELNDPRLQEELFKTQLAGLPPEDSMAKMDVDFVRALKVGMPPAGGMGIGIDRLVMLLTNSRSIRDVICFPLLRPERCEVGGETEEEDTET